MKERIGVIHISNPKKIPSCANFFGVFFKRWGPHLQHFEYAFRDYMIIVQEDKEDEFIKTFENHEIEETTYNSMEGQSLKISIND